MERILLENAVLLDPEAGEAVAGSLLLEGGRIAGRPRPGERPPDARRVDLGGRSLAPGFLDLHYHGSLPFGAPGDLAAALERDARALLAGGTTAFLPTTVAWSEARLRDSVTHLAETLTRRPKERDGPGAAPLGLHLEGPWIRPEAAGAQPPAGIREYSSREGVDLFARGEGCIKMVTLAPEIPGADALLEDLARRGVLAALGHSHCDASAVGDAVERGARHVTHLFNAMGPLHQRAPGLAGAALADDRLTCDLICDGVHVDPALVRVAFRAKGERLVLATDRIDPPPGADFGSGPLRERDGALRLPDRTLAGSCLTLDSALRNAQRFAGVSQLEAVAACTLRPARCLGVESERGTLRAGARADLAILDADGTVLETWLAGTRVC